MEDFIKLIISSIATILTFIFGGLDLPIQLLLLVILADYITGVIRSGIYKKLSSEAGLKGILKKVGILCIITVAVVIDRLTINNGMLRCLVIYYFIANECLSIIENLGECGVPIPQKLKNAILTFQKENEDK